MGLKILTPTTCKYGFVLPTCYISFLGNYNICKIRGHTVNHLTGETIPTVSYRVSSIAQLWVDKDSVGHRQPLGDYLIDTVMTEEDLNKNVLREFLYPALIQHINPNGDDVQWVEE